ncbi:MAG: hypothetical protein MUO92_01035, partial [Dehalococcoidales bacterium]|nr:hypothetical protein [Dehalococcoidales bacterium]
ILSGLAAALYGHSDGQYIFNTLGVNLGDELYEYAIQYFGDPHSFSAHYSVPWILRTPQIVLFTSAISFSLIGLVIQLIYNAVKKPPAGRAVTTLITSISLVALLCISTGVVYASQSERQRVGPTQPSAVPVLQVYVPGEEAPQIPDWDTITTHKVESLSVSSPSGGGVWVTTGVINTGDVAGMVDVEIAVDGKVLNSSEIALKPGESGEVRFFVRFPLPGVYDISVGDLSETVEIQG